jgi:lipopolysaccharide transport system ATP-binding protein
MDVMPDICLSVKGISKKFSRSPKRAMVYGAYDLARALLGTTGQTSLRTSEFWALKDVTCTLRRGQSLGIVGPNGSGKTTLMRLIAGVLAPTRGVIQVHGRMAPLLALGAGFKPVLSGRQNIVLNLSLLGVSSREIHDRMEAIIDFAEIGQAIDAPLGTYSSGMTARLGFACAVHTHPQILIVDEVLSVGDAKFRIKCRNRINHMRRSGTAMLLVSHSAISIQTLCDECLYLKQGAIEAQGTPDKVLAVYESDIVTTLAADNAARLTDVSRPVPGTSPLKILAVRFTSRNLVDEGAWVAGESGDLVLTMQSVAALENVSVNVIITDLTHRVGEIVQFMTSHRDIGWLHLEPGHPEVRLAFPAVGLRPGTYRVQLSLSQGSMHDIVDAIEDIRLVVRDTGFQPNCLYFQPRDWNLIGGAVSELTVPSRGSELETADKL